MACSEGDIILISSSETQGVVLGQHSFIVLNAIGGEIHGLSFDITCNVMGSFHDPAHKKKKLQHEGNFTVPIDGTYIENGNNAEGYIKADQLYYFSDSKTAYIIIGKMKPETFQQLIDFIQALDPEIFKEIIDNL